MTGGASPAAGRGIRIAYLTSQYPATSHTFISREVAALRRLGVSVETFSIRAPAPVEMSDEAVRNESASTYTVLDQPWTSFAGAHIATLSTRPLRYLKTLALALEHRPPGARGLALSLAHFAEAILLATALKRRGIGRLHNHFANSGATVGYLAAKLLGLPWSFTMHGISETDYPAGLLLADKIRAADFVACVSYFGRAQAMRLVEPEHWDKLHVVRCGLRLDTLPKRGPGTKPGIISVGRLSPEKGQAGLLQAFAKISREMPELELVLVGDGPELAHLQAMAKKLKIGQIHFAGRLGESDTLDRIAQADILVLASFMEGLPIVIMEAMALGTAVIASRVAGIPELVEDGESGLLFTPSNWDELADCMRRLTGDAPLRKRLAKAGRKVVAEGFDIDRSARQLRFLLTGETPQ